MTAVVVCAQLPLVTADKAESVIGQQCVVEGAVLSTTKTEDACHLHFGKQPKTAFTAVIFSINLGRWPGDVAAFYQGKTVRVTGVVQRFRSRLEMVVADPAQITLVSSSTPAAAAVPAAALAPGVLVGSSISGTPLTNVSTGSAMDTAILPFTVDVRRFTGARRGTGASDAGGGAAFRQRVYIEAALHNVTSQTVSDLAWQWVATAMTITGGGETYYQGSEVGISLQRFENRTLRSDEIKLSGVASARYGTTSGTKIRGHFVKIFWKGQLVFKEAAPPEMERDGEAFLERQQKTLGRR